MTYRIFFYVQHLLGIGHLVRSYRIAKALAAGGNEVVIANGGLPAPGFDHGNARLVQLPPVKAGPSDFSQLVHADGALFGLADQQRRKDQLLRHFEATAPHALLIEAFPFGRRQMRFELMPLLANAKTAPLKPLIASSVRDILQEQKNPARVEETAALVATFFDAVLVHGEPDLARFDETFPLASRFADRLVYTGLVGPETGTPPPQQHYDVIVSAGGGAVGGDLIRAALLVRRKPSWATGRWLVVTGPHMPPAVEAELQALGDPNVTRVRFVADLPNRLRGTDLSISQAGYNTVADVLAAGCRSVLVPFAADGETEQTRRADIWQKHGLAVAVEARELDPERLAAAMQRALALPQTRHRLKLDGALRTRLCLERMLQERFSGVRSA